MGRESVGGASKEEQSVPGVGDRQPIVLPGGP
jgi:hypothetical protein